MSLKVLGRGEVVVISNYDNLLFNIQLRGQQEKIKEVIKKMCEKVNHSKKKKHISLKGFHRFHSNCAPRCCSLRDGWHQCIIVINLLCIVIVLLFEMEAQGGDHSQTHHQFET